MFTGRISAVSRVDMRTRFNVFKFGDNEKVINPGDLLIQGEKGDNAVQGFELYISGRDMEQLLRSVKTASELYELNKEWLNKAVTRYLPALEVAEISGDSLFDLGKQIS